MCIHAHMHIYVCACVCMYTMYMCACAYMHVCNVYTYTCVCIQYNTYIHYIIVMFTYNICLVRLSTKLAIYDRDDCHGSILLESAYR